MSHQIALLGLMALTHILCYAAMTERKYSVRKTALLYALYAAFFLGSKLVLSACLGAESTHTVGIAFSATIAAGFLIFIWTSSDVFCKKLFLFISYSNLFCIFHFVAVLICNALFPSMSGIEMQYARNIARTLLYIPTVLAYLKFLVPAYERSRLERSGHGIPSPWFPRCSWLRLRLSWCFSIRTTAVLKMWFCLRSS